MPLHKHAVNVGTDCKQDGEQDNVAAEVACVGHLVHQALQLDVIGLEVARCLGDLSLNVVNDRVLPERTNAKQVQGCHGCDQMATNSHMLART